MTLKLTDCVQGNGTADGSDCTENSQTDERSIDKDVKVNPEGENSDKAKSQSETENDNTATYVTAVEKESTDKRNYLCKQERVLHEDGDDTNVEDINAQETDSFGNKLHVPSGLPQRFLSPKLPNVISFSSDGSVDVDDNAHEQFQRLNEITVGKSWDDELKEDKQEIESNSESTIEDVDTAEDLGEEPTSKGDTLSNEVSDDTVEGIDTLKCDAKDEDELADLENEVGTNEQITKQNYDNQLEQIPQLQETDETDKSIQQNAQLEDQDSIDQGDKTENVELISDPPAELPASSLEIATAIELDLVQSDGEEHHVISLDNEELSANDSFDTNRSSCEGDSENSIHDPNLSETVSPNKNEIECPIEIEESLNNASVDDHVDTADSSISSENKINTAGLSVSVDSSIVIKESLDNASVDVDTADSSICSEYKINALSVSVDSSVVDLLTMPESRTSDNGCPSPSLMYATCRYRWERSVVTESNSVVFVTLNKKEIEPIKLEWTEGSKCFYSEELKIPIGVYVGNLVIDGTFYPVEDISVKHYTFEVDLYLKDDILEDESTRSKGEQSYTVNGGELKPKELPNGSPSPDYNHPPVKTASYTYSPIRARMEEEPKQSANQTQPDGSIHVSSKYEDLVRSQMSHTKNALIDSDSDAEIAQSIKSNLSDGRRSPIGGDGAKQYQDSDDTAARYITGYTNGTDADSTALKEVVNGSLVEDDVERKNGWSGLESGSGQPQVITIDDVLGNGQNRTPIYCTESPIHSRHSSAHSSARQTPTAVSIHSSARQTPTQGDGQEAVRPDSTTSTHSANSLSRHLLDDIFNDALGRSRTSPAREGSQSRSREGSRHGSNRQTPQMEQIDDVLNPSDRHSPIRRDYLTGSPNVSNYSAHSSAQGSTHGSVKGSANGSAQGSTHGSIVGSAHGSLPGSIHGSLQGSTHGSLQGSTHGSLQGSTHSSVVGSAHNSLPGSTHGSLHASAHSSTRGSVQGSVPGSTHGSTHNSVPGSAHSSQRHTPQADFITDTLRATEEKLYSLSDVRRLSGSEHASNHGSNNGGSRPQSLSSEQELTQYYESLVDPRRTPVPGSGPRTPSASSLPAIGTPQGSTEKRSMTPDNYIRVPVGASAPTTKAGLLPGRVTPRNTPVSNASSRTITPVNADVQETRDLESTVATLRALLASREPEVLELKAQFDEVKEINRKLQGDLDRLRARASPGPQIAELERKYREALEEREIVKAEALRLKEELRRKDEPSLNDYDPNGPTALQRKIGELSSQISDLQEVNETAMEEVRASEKRVKELAAENEMLRVTQSSRAHGTEEENRQLKSEVARLREQHMAESNLGDYRVKIELQQVKEDNRNLRERNYQLHDDNIMLKEELSSLRKSLEMVDSFKKQHKEERVGSTRVLESYARDNDKEKLMESSSYSREVNSHGKLRSDPVLDRTDLSLEAEKSRNSYYQALLESRSRLEADQDRRLEYTETKSRYDTQLESRSRYESRTTTTTRGETEYDDRFTKSEPVRYEHYRSIPDGDVSDKPSRPSPLYDTRPLTPERPSSLGPPKDVSSGPRSLELSRYDRYQQGDRERSRRSRTTSAELEYRSMPVTGYPTEMSKTTPALSGRSRAIYKEISNLRNQSRPDNWNSPREIPPELPREFPRESPQLCESESQNNQEPATLNTNKNRSHTCAVFVNRYVPNNQQGAGRDQSGDTKLPSAGRDGDFSNIRASQSRQQVLAQLRPTDREDKGYDVHASSGYQDEGDVSDTATDILVNASPLDRAPASWNKPRLRRGSVGSEGSNSSYSDIDEQLTATARKRSKSADGREILRRMAPTGSTSRSGATTPVKGERPLSRTMSPAPTSAGFRTVMPKPLATQHNKTILNFSTSTTLTHGLRPFAPRSAGDLQVKDVIKFSRQGGKLSQGTIKFIGHLPGRGDIYLGVELDKEDGKHDGTFEGIRYFRCKPSKGVFVAYNKVVMAWTSY